MQKLQETVASQLISVNTIIYIIHKNILFQLVKMGEVFPTLGLRTFKFEAYGHLCENFLLERFFLNFALIHFLHSFPMHSNHLKLFLNGPSQPHICFCLHTEFGYYIILSGHVEAKEVTVKLSKMKGHTTLVTQFNVKQYDFTSPCNINNFDGIKNGRH